MGLTILEPESAWNTMPCHTHERRMEVYLYLDVPEDQCIIHFMGKGQETMHIVMKNEQAVISPMARIFALARWYYKNVAKTFQLGRTMLSVNDCDEEYYTGFRLLYIISKM